MKYKAEVVHGVGRGHSLQVPTANLNLEEAFPSGVYAARVWLRGSMYLAALHAGPRPTFGEEGWHLELHLLDFEGDLYGQDLEFELLERLRDVKKFESVEALKAQIQEDVSKIRSRFKME